MKLHMHFFKMGFIAEYIKMCINCSELYPYLISKLLDITNDFNSYFGEIGPNLAKNVCSVD